MGEIALVIIAITFVYAVYKHFKSQKGNEAALKEAEKRELIVKDSLPLLLGKEGEFHFKEPLQILEYQMSIKGKVLDADSEWVLLSTPSRKEDTRKMFRISSIKEIREIRK